MANAQAKRGRDSGLPFAETPGANYTITDVARVVIGTVTLISGDGPLGVGKLKLAAKNGLALAKIVR